MGFVGSTPSIADDLIISHDLVQDVPSDLTITDIAGREATPFRSTVLLGTDAGVHWLRVRLRPPPEGEKAVLLIRPSTLNDVRLYQADPAAPQGWNVRVTGNLHPFDQRDRPRPSLGFVISVAAPEETLFLRIESRRFSIVDVEAMTVSEADRYDFDREITVVFFTTAMAAIFLWAVHGYILDRRRLYAFFAAHQLIYTLFGIGSTGYLAALFPAIPPAVTDWISAALYLSIGLTMTLFCRDLFKPYDPPRKVMRIFDALILVFLINYAILLIGEDSIAAISNSITMKLMLFYFAIASFTLKKEGAPKRKYIQILFSFIFINNLAFWIPGYLFPDSSPVKWSGIQTLLIDGFLIGCLFAMVAYVRSHQLRREARQATQALQDMTQTLQAEKELKIQAENKARTDYLTGFFNRRHFLDLSRREMERSARYQRPFTLLMIDIDHFKSLNDRWGHHFGDQVLQDVSRALHDTLRTVDIFGRIGGEEFAAVIVEAEEDEAAEIAQRLRQAVESLPLQAPDGRGVQATVSIGITHLRGRQVDFDSVMVEADRAMYAAKNSGRNKIMVTS